MLRCAAAVANNPGCAVAARAPQEPPHVVPRTAELRRRVAASLGAAAVVLSAAAAPLSASAADLKLGAEVFENSCAVCHAGGLNNIAGEEKHTLKRDALEKYGLYSREAIAEQVRQGKDAMPPFRDALSAQEIEAVAAFVFDQAAGDKW